LRHHDPILFRKGTRKIWIKDKYKTALNQKQISYLFLMPNLFLLFGFIADFFSLIKIKHDTLTLLLLIFLFIYGIINLCLLFWFQRNRIRLERDRNTFRILHKNVVEQFREYLFKKTKCTKDKQPFTKIEIEKHIRGMLKGFYENFIKHYHGDNITVTLKYRKNDQLISLREGEYAPMRILAPEPLKVSYVYQSLSETGKKWSYIYVKNLDDPDKYETEILGQNLPDVKKRALDNYKTFIALPIRAGKLELDSTEFITRPDLGIIGFDSLEEYKFGNFDPHELDIMACLADLLSELVQDLIMID
jgi:hypothetical protein